MSWDSENPTNCPNISHTSEKVIPFRGRRQGRQPLNKWMKVGVYSPLTRSIYPPNTNLPIYLALGGPCRKKYHLSFQSLTTITGSMGISGTYSLEVPIPYICLAYVSGLDFREYPHKIWPDMVQFLHSRILKFPLTQ